MQYFNNLGDLVRHDMTRGGVPAEHVDAHVANVLANVAHLPAETRSLEAKKLVDAFWTENSDLFPGPTKAEAKPTTAPADTTAASAPKGMIAASRAARDSFIADAGNPWMAGRTNLTAQMAILKADPQRAAALKAEAGVR